MGGSSTWHAPSATFTSFSSSRAVSNKQRRVKTRTEDSDEYLMKEELQMQEDRKKKHVVEMYLSVHFGGGACEFRIVRGGVVWELRGDVGNMHKKSANVKKDVSGWSLTRS